MNILDKIIAVVLLTMCVFAVQAREATVTVKWGNGNNTEGTEVVGQVALDGEQWQELFRVPVPATSYQANVEAASGVNLCIRVRAEKAGFDPTEWHEALLNCRVVPHDEALQQSVTHPLAWSAKDYNANICPDVNKWVLNEKGYIQALPKYPSGDPLHARFVDINTRAPVLKYTINFKKTGVHYLWVNAPPQTSDRDPHNSINVRLGESVITGIQLNNWTGTQRASGSRLQFDITAVGEQDLEVYMREDGTQLIGFVLTDNVSYIPDGTEIPSARTLLVIPDSVVITVD